VIRCLDVVVPRLFTTDHLNFYIDLGAGRAPNWLTPVPLPPELSAHYRVYEVNGR
jgi:hypothetical protein